MSLLSAVLQEADNATCEELKKHCDKLLPVMRDLTERIQLLTFALQQYFTDTYVNFTLTKSLEQLNYKNRKANIINDYSTLIQDVENMRRNYNMNGEEFTKSCDKLNKDFKLLNDLCVLVESKKVLEKANHDFGRFNYSDAMLGIRELQNKLKNLKFEDKLQEGLGNLKAQAENQLALYTAQLSTEWDEVFQWTEKRNVYFLTYSLSVEQSDPALIQKLLKTLYSIERLNAELGLFSHFFIDKLLHNVIRHNCEIFTEDHIGAIVFNIKIDLNDPKKPNYQSIFNNLTAIFEFLESTLGSQFEGDRKFIEVFADSIRGKFFDKIIKDCIQKNLPSCNSSYKTYRDLVDELDVFNKFLIDLKFVESDKSPLNQYVNDTESVLFNKKCDKLLSDVRELLKESLMCSPIDVGTAPCTENESILDVTDKDCLWDLNRPLFLPKCVVSQNVKKIMTLIVDHLEESVKLPEKYSKQLALYVKDIATMYQCIVPQNNQTYLENSPLDIALFFNNCFYLAHGLLGPPWKTILPASLADLLATVLLDSIQDLRVLGLEKMSMYLQKQKNKIVETVESRDTTPLEPWSQERYDQFDTAVNDAVVLLKSLRSAWLPILPPQMYEKSLCALIQTLCQSVLLKVFADSKPISEELVYMMAVRLEETIKDIEGLFEEPIPFETKIDVWSKFIKLPQLLKAQLLELAELWTRSKELAQSYSCEEIRQLVKMRFPDDKYRLKILKEIQ
ncbi:hypothetical protein ABMA28_003109 [Loxostege sticticalis]|uniref:Centromere/kinetochore protein zw10 homolog n=1 Tax=Loxostege sticticalis TaxID=481309 RepID=A0ABD0SV12_LOXSC